MDVHLYVIITRNCNLRCGYCPARKEKKTIRPETVDCLTAMLAQRNSDSTIVNIHGGEPLLEFGLIRRLVDALPPARRHESNVFVSTNGTLLTPEALKYFRQRRVSLRFSCDGPFHAHIAHRHGRSGWPEKNRAHYERTVRNISRAVRAGLSTKINMVVTPETVDTLCDSYRFLHSLGVELVEISPAMGIVWERDGLVALAAQLRAVARAEGDGEKPASSDFPSHVRNKCIESAYFLGRAEKHNGAFSFVVDHDGSLYADEYDEATKRDLFIGNLWSTKDLREIRELKGKRESYFELIFKNRLFPPPVLKSMKLTQGLLLRHYRELEGGVRGMHEGSRGVQRNGSGI